MARALYASLTLVVAVVFALAGCLKQPAQESRAATVLPGPVEGPEAWLAKYEFPEAGSVKARG